MRRTPLPDVYCYSPAELAHEWGTHPDRVMRYCDAGLIEPAVMVAKSALPFDCPGPASHIVVLLPDYRAMDWQTAGADRVAHLAGEYRAFQLDGKAFRNLTLSGCDQVQVSRADLVITHEQREAIEAMGATVKPLNPSERNSYLLMIEQLARKAYPSDWQQHYKIAERISADLDLRGLTLSAQTIAYKLDDAATAAERAEEQQEAA